MSRNLARTDCYFCPDTPTIQEQPRPITAADAGAYFDEYRGMLIANAECPLCEAKYLAWVDEHGREQRFSWPPPSGPGEIGFFDLSFRSTFNDEPGVADLPRWEIKTTVTHERVGRYRRGLVCP